MTEHRNIAIIGGGPAGLMAAETLSQNGYQIDLFDRMPSVGRKFLMAGKGGMNITHSEPAADFLSRYGDRQTHIAPLLEAFGPNAVREWIHGLGIATFVGSSGRVFPTDMKAAPLLRAWLHRLREANVRIHVRHRWQGIERQVDGRYLLRFDTPEGDYHHLASAVVFALGGASWSKLGSDGQWVSGFAANGIPVAPLRPANCGFTAAWSNYIRERFAGQPVKNVAARVTDPSGRVWNRQGEFVITETGIEGGLTYALSAPLRDMIEKDGHGTLYLDLLPAIDQQRVCSEVSHSRGSRSLSSHLQSRLGLKGIKLALLHECLTRTDFTDPHKLAVVIKNLPLRLIAPRPLDEAISSAGGVRFEALDERWMVRQMPGVFCAGEMVDWEAPTGGYLLTACLASGHAIGINLLGWLEQNP